MPQAKILTNAQIRLSYAASARTLEPARNRLMQRLSVECGLRAKEIAFLEHADVTDADGKVTGRLHVSKRGGKYGRERDLWMPEDLRAEMARYLQECNIKRGRIFIGQYGEPMSANAVQKQIGRLYRLSGLVGASSHSGRRTCLTRAAQLCGRFYCSIKDVQLMAGHARISSMEPYLGPSKNQRAMMESLYQVHIPEMIPARVWKWRMLSILARWRQIRWPNWHV